MMLLLSRRILRAASFPVCLLLVLACQQAAAADAWRDPSQPVERRVESLLTAMTQEQKIALVAAESDEDHTPLLQLGLPVLRRVDASCGLRGDYGVTALPVPISLAASFDAGLARSYGRLIAEEALDKRWNVILGPTLDIARDPLNGRTAEGFGEDPLLSGEMASAVVNGMQSLPVLAMAKHYTAYQRENDRLTMDVRLSERALREIYNRPFEVLFEKSRIGALMGSYPRINGVFACENKELLSVASQDPRFQGFFATDYEAGQDGVAQINAGIDSWSLQPNRRERAAFKDGRIPAARLDDAVRRVLRPVFSLGLFDHTGRAQAVAVASTAEHRRLALEAAIAGSVLLKNQGGLLPLRSDTRIALIGPAGADFITGVQGSSYVRPGHGLNPVEAISALASNSGCVTHTQGSLGDVPLEPLSPFYPKGHTLLAEGGQPGWTLEVFSNETLTGVPARVLLSKDGVLSESGLPGNPGAWSARLSATLTLDSDSLARFSVLCGGSCVLRVNDEIVLKGRRAQAHFFAGDGGPYAYPLQGCARFRAGIPARVTVEYSTMGSVWARELRIGWQRTESLRDRAVAAAKAADVAVVFVNEVSGEEMDHETLSLPGDQEALIEAVAAANPKTVVILNTPSALVMPWLSKVRAVLDVWYPGTMGGEALARMLYGLSEPGGRLPLSFPASDSERPKAYDGSGTMVYEEGVFVGYRYYQNKHLSTLFPFGYGLGYATPELKLVSLKAAPASEPSVLAHLRLRVNNPSQRSTTVRVQVYARPPTGAKTVFPVRVLAAFRSLQVKAGASEELELALERSSLSYWDEASHAWGLIPGEWLLELGQNVDDTTPCGHLQLP